uniref:uncharacterized protein LOC122609787 n=1 Tax=Erigeron canadensis TaxID=72917 RepID=UPI001CB8C127|nr:uncharacterized protein LOC122609787 [Erigeron canadensis]
MWGFGGRLYWGCKKEELNNKGIVVVFAWMSSQDKHLNNYVNLYSSFGWNSLVCHFQFFNLFFPDKAASLALDILNELIKELKDRPCPVVFASFSGGPKASLYKVIQIIDGTSKTHKNQDEYRLVRECLSGHIFDSTPADFTSDVGTRLFLHPSVLKMSHPPIIVTWVANGIASCLDALFLPKVELQRADYWQTLYSTAAMGAPYLILCSEADDIAPYQTIFNFSQRLKSLGADVKLIKWSSSPHVGHYLHHPEEYKSAVGELLTKAASLYTTRLQQLKSQNNGIQLGHNKIPDPLSHLREAISASDMQPKSKKMALDRKDHLIMSGSMEYDQVREVGSVQDEFKESVIRPSALSTMKAYGILGQILFDVCVPKNVEDWDLRPLDSNQKNSHFDAVKCIHISKL